MSALTHPHAVDELKRAWQAVEAGEFASPSRPPLRTSGGITTATTWQPDPGETTVAVAGCAGSVGATVTALAIAEGFGGPARVVECSSAPVSGLAAASTAELGVVGHGWRQGRRDGVVLERMASRVPSPAAVPAPAPSQLAGLTVLDTGWDVAQLHDCSCWLSEALISCEHLVLITVSTVPGMRRLESALTLLDDHSVDLAVGVVGPRRRKWPKAVTASMGRLTRQLVDTRPFVDLPEDPQLHVNGLDSKALPPALISAAAQLIPSLSRPASDFSTGKEHS